jgi:hypothetical protein
MITLQNPRFAITLFSAIALAIITTELLIAASPVFTKNSDQLSLAITFDLVVLLPTFFYFLIVRPLKLNPIFVVSVYIVSAWMAYFILPKTQHFYLNWVWYSLTLVELSWAIWAMAHLKTIVKMCKSFSERTPQYKTYFYEKIIKNQ